MSEIVYLSQDAGTIPPNAPRLRCRGMVRALRWRTGEALLSAFCAENMVGLADLQGGPRSGKHASIVVLRRRFCMLAKANGIGPIYIGRLLKMDHSTVTYHVNPRFRAEKRTKREKYDRNRRRKPDGQDQGARGRGQGGD